MKLIIALLVTSEVMAAEFNQSEFDKFVGAIAKVESNNNPKAINKKENALGLYQIRPAYFKDAQESDKNLKEFNHEDCYDPEVAKKVVKVYMNRYCKGGNIEDMARCHNSGPGWKKKKNITNGYWKKVQAQARRGWRGEKF